MTIPNVRDAGAGGPTGRRASSRQVVERAVGRSCRPRSGARAGRSAAILRPSSRPRAGPAAKENDDRPRGRRHVRPV